MLHAYPFWSLVAAAAVVAIELLWARTGLFRDSSYWIAMVIVFAFMIPVDGWMSKTTAPIVEYNAAHVSGLRFPWDIPVEEFVYAFALVTLTMVLWERARRADTL